MVPHWSTSFYLLKSSIHYYFYTHTHSLPTKIPTHTTLSYIHTTLSLSHIGKHTLFLSLIHTLSFIQYLPYTHTHSLSLSLSLSLMHPFILYLSVRYTLSSLQHPPLRSLTLQSSSSERRNPYFGRCTALLRIVFTRERKKRKKEKGVMAQKTNLKRLKCRKIYVERERRKGKT